MKQDLSAPATKEDIENAVAQILKVISKAIEKCKYHDKRISKLEKSVFA